MKRQISSLRRQYELQYRENRIVLGCRGDDPYDRISLLAQVNAATSWVESHLPFLGWRNAARYSLWWSRKVQVLDLGEIPF